MTAYESIRKGLTQAHGMLDETLEEIIAAKATPGPGRELAVYTTAWLLFHTVRTEDHVVHSVLRGRRSSAWTEGGFAARLGLAAGASSGGMPPEEVQVILAHDLTIWRAYQRSVWMATEALLETSDEAFWERVVTIQPFGAMHTWLLLAQISLTHGVVEVVRRAMARALGTEGSLAPPPAKNHREER